MFTGYCDKGPGAYPDPDCKMYKDRILLRQSCFRKCVWSKLSAWIWLSDAIQKIGIVQCLWQRMVTKAQGLAPVLIENVQGSACCGKVRVNSVKIQWSFTATTHILFLKQGIRRLFRILTNQYCYIDMIRNHFVHYNCYTFFTYREKILVYTLPKSASFCDRQ